MANKQGSLSINSENIFPIIKKWLYSDHDIFFRELISNGCDAITKLKKLDMMGEYTIPDDTKFKIDVILNPTDKTIKFIDNGLGMTIEEVDEYINQIAFSGAQDFLNKYKDKTNEDQIIGHFGLGFYSAFMVADRVEIDTLSCKDGAKAVHWESEGGNEYEMSDDSSKTTVGTEITLHLNEDSYEFSNEYRAREVIEKYCSFMPIEIYLTDETKEPEYEEVEVESAKKDSDDEDSSKSSDSSDDAKKDDSTENTESEVTDEKSDSTKNTESEVVDEKGEPIKEKRLKKPTPLNDINPLWTKHPNECTDEEYKEFYRKVFMDFKEPLFWIHLNMDYPFNLKGILYFPKINTEYESIEGTIKLYNNQVFIADNIKEVIPEFLMLLKGVIDCPDLPLNVSRSALQNDGFVKKISDYITKKVADKLSGMCKTDRKNYEKYWDDINPFIKFGCLKDEKFAEKMNDYIIFKNLDGKYLTLPDCLKENEEKHKNTVFYVTDENEQGQYIHMFKQEGIDAVILSHNIDTPFITQLEQKNKDVKFVRIDADLSESFKEENADTESEDFKKTAEELTALFKKELNNDKLDVKVEKLKNNAIASMMTASEESRRMQEMMKQYAMYGMDSSMFPGASETLILNANHPLVQYVLEHKENENTALICEQLYDLALLGHGTLSPERMTKFIERSNQVMLLLSK